MKPWRIGSKVPLNVYEQERPVCQCHSEDDAQTIVEAVNRNLRSSVDNWNPSPVHTPGPWYRDQDMPTMILNHPLVAATEIIAQTSGEANARLICAAPELLVALEGLLPLAEKMFGLLEKVSQAGLARLHPDGITVDDLKFVKQARSAIFKAQGSQSPSQQTTTGDDQKAATVSQDSESPTNKIATDIANKTEQMLRQNLDNFQAESLESSMLRNPMYCLGKILLLIRRLSTDEANVVLLGAQTLNQASPRRENGERA
jgi:hypothetical protein